VYPDGGHAGVLELTGLMPWSGFIWTVFDNMRDARSVVPFLSQFVAMPKAIIESVRYGKRDGPYLPFSITLVENW
jgi:hypothetical protein